ncbi:MAG: LamG domain-containing protein, partial [Opitutales bacterium]|nr:LamG domain-containing protein [Opitutales bacterium]
MISRLLPFCSLLFLATASVGLFAVIKESELKLRWSFDEGVGSSASNQIGTGLDVILYPGVFWGHESNGTAKSGYALDLSNGASRGSVMHDTRLQANDDFSYMFWFKTNGIPDDYSQLLSKRQGTYSSYFVQVDPGGGTLKTLFRKYGKYYDTGPVSFAPNQWHLLTAVHDGEKIITYLDNQLVYETEQLNPIFVEEGQLGVGGTADGGSLFRGWIDDLRIYGKALSFRDVKNAWGDGAGDFGPTPDFSGVDRSPVSMPLNITFSFRDSSGTTRPTTGIDQSDIIISGGTISNFSKITDTQYSFDLNATKYPQRILVTVPAAAGRDDQNITTCRNAVYIIYGDIVTQSEDLVGWWTFDIDEANGTHAFDSSGGDHTAILKGNAIIADPGSGGKLMDGALRLDGLNSLAEV